MMQRAQGPQRQFVSVYNVPDADREKEAGNRRMWSQPVKVKHWEQRLDTDTHIFFRESKFGDWSAYGAIQSVGRRETLKGPAIPDLTQPTIFVTHDAFFALGMRCSVLGRGAEPPQFWVFSIWLEPGISHVTWVHYDATMCLACFVCSILPVLHFLRFDLFVL